MLNENSSEIDFSVSAPSRATNLKSGSQVLPICKDSSFLQTPAPLVASSVLSRTESTSKSCGVPLPRPMLTVPRMTPGTPERFLALPNTEQSQTDQDKELALILNQLESAYVKVRRLRQSLKRIRPISLDTTTESEHFKQCYQRSPEFEDLTDYLRHHECYGSMDPLAVERQQLSMKRSEISLITPSLPETDGLMDITGKK